MDFFGGNLALNTQCENTRNGSSVKSAIKIEITVASRVAYVRSAADVVSEQNDLQYIHIANQKLLNGEKKI